MSSDPPVSSVLRSPHMAQHDLTMVTRLTWHLELGAAEVRRVTMVMVAIPSLSPGVFTSLIILTRGRVSTVSGSR